MTTKHTPAPWFANLKNEGGFEITDREDCWEAVVLCTRFAFPEKEEETHANARLISAAPDLLAALIALDDCYCSAGPHLTKDERHQHRMTLIAARAAVAKATGAA